MLARKGRGSSLGCPSWIHIEPCVTPQNRVLGGFWKTCGSCDSYRIDTLGDAAVGRIQTFEYQRGDGIFDLVSRLYLMSAA
jgi:hypothetical protein